MKAEDFIQWLEEESEFNSQNYLYLQYIENLKNKNNSYTISVRQFLSDKPELLLDYIEQNGMSNTPNFIYHLINVYFRNGLFSTVDYLLNLSKDNNKLKTLKNEIQKFFNDCYKNKRFAVISYFHYYSNIKKIMIELNKSQFELSVNFYINENPNFKKELYFINIQKNIYNF